MMEKKPLPATEITVALTSACNLSCRMCGQRGDRSQSPPRPASLDKETVKRVIDDTTAAAPSAGFYFWGGEPLLHPGLIELCRYAKSHHAYVDINTNGVYLKEYARALVESRVNALYISLDGPNRASCDEIRGEGVFDAAVRGVRAVLKYRGHCGQKQPEVHFVCTILASSYELLTDFVPLCRSLGVDGLCVQLPVYVTTAWGRSAAEMWKKLFVLEFNTWKAFDFPHLYQGIVPEKLAETLESLKSEARGFALNITPAGYSTKQLSEYFQDSEWISHSRQARCTKIDFRLNIQPDGNVTPCGDFTEYVCGNIYQEPLLDIWNGEKYRYFRDVINRSLLPNCYRCCELFDGRERSGDP